MTTTQQLQYIVTGTNSPWNFQEAKETKSMHGAKCIRAKMKKEYNSVTIWRMVPASKGFRARLVELLFDGKKEVCGTIREADSFNHLL